MPRDLRIGDAVKTPAGNQVVIALSPSYVTTATRADVDTLYARDALYPHEWTRDEVEPLPRDIPREHVEMLHAAVAKRLTELEREGMSGDLWRVDTAHVSHCELSEVAEALRVLLEGEVCDGD